MKRLLVALLAIALIATRAVLPDIRFDETSLALFGIVCLAVLWPDVRKMAASIHRFRFGELELELAEKVGKLSEEAQNAQEAESQQRPGKRKAEEISPEVAKRIAEAGTDPRSALLLMGIEIERAVQRLGKRHGFHEFASAQFLMSQLADKGVVSQELVSLFGDFWKVRNQVAHQAGFDIPAGQLYELLDVGLTILKLLS